MIIRAIPGAAGTVRRAATLVQQARWARGLTREQLDEVLAHTEERSYAAGDCALHAGEPVAHWTGVVEGFAKMSVASAQGRASTLTGVSAGVWFGEGSLMKREARRYDVVALRPLRLALVPRSVFEWLRDTSIPFNHSLQDLLNARLSLFIGMLSEDRLLDTDARVAHGLASLFHDDLYPNASPHVQLNQGEVGLLANVSRQRANVALRRLQAHALIRIGRQGLTVLDIDGLRRVADGRPLNAGRGGSAAADPAR
ncbi:MAG: Crp/Fnr family transcriptional regulator [Ideonella sp.]|nr:Crp/Fnr family transcriptional regulator [Ideonella sp.]